jgi:hypothetical protein
MGGLRERDVGFLGATSTSRAFIVNLIAKADRNLVLRLPYGGLDDRAITRPVERR